VSAPSARGGPPSFSRFLARSFALMEDELPWAYRAVSARLSGRAVHLEVDDESVWVRSIPGRIELRSTPLAACVHLSTRRSVIRALIRGEDTLLDAILAGRVELKGTVDDLIAFDAGLMAYLHGAVRCPPFAALSQAYLLEPDRAVQGQDRSREAVAAE
jgi:hypothetical protein